MHPVGAGPRPAPTGCMQGRGLDPPAMHDDHPPKSEGPAQNYHVIARRAKPDVAIRVPCGAKHRPSTHQQPPAKPEGPAKFTTSLRGGQSPTWQSPAGMREIATPLRARNDVEILGWSCCFFCGGDRGFFRPDSPRVARNCFSRGEAVRKAVPKDRFSD